MTASTVTKTEDKRAAFIGDLRTLADWLDANPWAPTPTNGYVSVQLNGMNDTEPAAALAAVRQFAEQANVKTDESLTDRTRARVTFGRMEYSLLCWHEKGRPGEPDERDVELERLRAEVEALRSATAADATGLSYSRTDGEADDPTPVSPGRVPLHTGAMVDGDQLVDETPVVCTCDTDPLACIATDGGCE